MLFFFFKIRLPPRSTRSDTLCPCTTLCRALVRGTWRSLRDVALPLARPAIAVGVTLALMECLNDFGTVDFFAVRTLTAGVFDVWLRMGNAGGAAQIALVMLGFVILLIWAERRSRARDRKSTSLNSSH